MNHRRMLLCCRSAVVVLAFLAGSLEAQTFRVLIAFTQQALSQGLSAHTAASAINGIAREVYANSSPTYSGYQMPKIELAGTVKVSYTGSSAADAVIALKNKTDNSMDEIHAWRDWYEADIVILVHPFTDVDGKAFKVETNHENTAFAVVSTPYIYTSTLAAHEIGHLVGCIHDDQDPLFVPASIDYAYGYRGPGNAWGDVMTYHSNRQKWFSNPYETYNGAARGIVDSADCTRKHHERKITLAGYRTTPHSLLNASRNLKPGESIFWDLPGGIYFHGGDTLPYGTVVSLKAGLGISLWSSVHAEGLIEAKGAWMLLTSPRYVEFSGVYTGFGAVRVTTDSLLMHKDTDFIGSIVDMRANVIRQLNGNRLTIAPETGVMGSVVNMQAKRQIRLTKGTKITSGPWGVINLKVSQNFDPFAPDPDFPNHFHKRAVEADERVEKISVFQSRIVQDRGQVSLLYELQNQGAISVRVFDLKGVAIASLQVPNSRMGANKVSVPGTFRKGVVYFVRVTFDGKAYTHKFVSAL